MPDTGALSPSTNSGFTSLGSSSNGFVTLDNSLGELLIVDWIDWSTLDADTSVGEMIWLATAMIMQAKKTEKLMRTSFTVFFIDIKDSCRRFVDKIHL